MDFDVFHMSGSSPTTISLRLNHRAKNLLEEEYPKAAEYICKESCGTWLFTAPINSINALARFYIGLADDIEIVDAPGLKERVSQLIGTLNETLYK